MGCFVVAEFLLTSVSRSPSAMAELLVKSVGPIQISGMAEARIVKLCTQAGYIKSCENGCCYGHITNPLKVFVPVIISVEQLKLEASNFVRWLDMRCVSIGMTNCPLSGHSHYHMNVFKFWQISGSISEMVQDRDIVTMEDK